jgi:hypothetical protein
MQHAVTAYSLWLTRSWVLRPGPFLVYATCYNMTGRSCSAEYNLHGALGGAGQKSKDSGVETSMVRLSTYHSWFVVPPGRDGQREDKECLVTLSVLLGSPLLMLSN